MIVNIVCGAPHEITEMIPVETNQVLNIGVDRGAIFLLEQNLPIAHAVGDFDSITQTQFNQLLSKNIELTKLEPTKDETDTEIALKLAMTYKPTEIRFIYALGGRLDHSLANIKLLMRLAKQGASAQIIMGSNSMRVLLPGTYDFPKTDASYVSFFAYKEDVKSLTLSGLKYELVDYTLNEDDIRCISNEVTESSFHVSFTSGLLIIINSSD